MRAGRLNSTVSGGGLLQQVHSEKSPPIPDQHGIMSRLGTRCPVNNYRNTSPEALPR